MSVVIAAPCLTRVVMDDEHAVELAQLQRVRQRIERMLWDVPIAQRDYIASALLELAVARMSAPQRR